MIQRIALYSTLGFLLDALGQSVTDWGFWSAVALFWAAEHLARRQGYEAGMVMVATLPRDKLEQIKQAVDKIEQEHKHKD